MLRRYNKRGAVTTADMDSGSNARPAPDSSPFAAFVVAMLRPGYSHGPGCVLHKRHADATAMSR
jgi:hypothetical protein